MANKTVYVDVVQEPDLYNVFFRVKDAKGNLLSNTKCEIFADQVITPSSQAITIINTVEGLGRLYDLPEATYGWRVTFPNGTVKTGIVIVDDAHAV